MTASVLPSYVPLPPVHVQAASIARGEGMRSTALPLLRAEEEPVLGFWIEAGLFAAAALVAGKQIDESSRAELVEVRSLGERSMERMTRSNIRLVYYWISRSWTGRDTGGLDVEDLAAVGVEGLIHAIWMWDYRRGLKFSTYASIWIRQHLDRAVVRARGLRPGGVDTGRLDDLFRARAQLEVRLGRTASTRELASELEVTVASVKDLLLLERNVRFTLRLDEPAGQDSYATVGDLLPSRIPAPEQLAIDAELHEELASALMQLTARERAVVMSRVGWAGPIHSEEDVAARYGVTVAQVRATTHRALTRLRVMLEDDLPFQGAAA